MKLGDMVAAGDVVQSAAPLTSTAAKNDRPPIPPHERFDPFMGPRSPHKDLDNRLAGVQFTPFCE
jgi:hypothetical protein